MNGSWDDACNEIDRLQKLCEEQRVEIERLNNRVNLLSVSANTIRDAYDNGLNAELKSQLATQTERIRELENKIEAMEYDAKEELPE